MITVALIIFIYMCLIWLWYLYTKNPSVVDVGWASGLTLSGLTYLYQHGATPRTIVLGLALLAWGVRLGGYLWWTRIRPKHIDKRYQALSASWQVSQALGFFANYQLQGLLIFLVSLCWYFIAANPSPQPTVIDITALILFMIALFFETLADHQLQAFRKAHPGQVCNEKLWRYSRHPNYFFEWLIWCAFSLCAFPTSYAMAALISPLTLYLIMNYVTIPLTERESIKSRGEAYLKYQSVTPAFFLKIRS